MPDPAGSLLPLREHSWCPVPKSASFPISCPKSSRPPGKICGLSYGGTVWTRSLPLQALKPVPASITAPAWHNSTHGARLPSEASVVERVPHTSPLPHSHPQGAPAESSPLLPSSDGSTLSELPGKKKTQRSRLIFQGAKAGTWKSPVTMPDWDKTLASGIWCRRLYYHLLPGDLRLRGHRHQDQAFAMGPTSRSRPPLPSLPLASGFQPSLHRAA